MTTPYIDELALKSKNNEAINEVILLTEKLADGSVVPVDLTGREFFAQARMAKGRDSDLLCVIKVTVFGDPTEGKLLFHVSDETMKDVPQARGHYDVLTRTGPTGSIDNLYQAPFIVEPGVTDLTQWQ